MLLAFITRIMTLFFTEHVSGNKIITLTSARMRYFYSQSPLQLTRDRIR